jgi:hypothetical protein
MPVTGPCNFKDKVSMNGYKTLRFITLHQVVTTIYSNPLVLVKNKE